MSYYSSQAYSAVIGPKLHNQNTEKACLTPWLNQGRVAPHITRLTQFPDTGKHEDFTKEHITGGRRPGMDPKIPTVMYYMWISATYYDGKLPLPVEGQYWSDFGRQMLHLVYTGAFPSLRAWRIYWAYYIFSAACYIFMPGFKCYGKPLAHLGGKKLPHYCSAFTGFYFTIFVMGALQFTGLFRISTLIDEFGGNFTD
ncbi:hypothetical protein AJ80_04734 [Polytolypa hystricis UAMH7299]|uniref:Uncharacterized protein n=1 Tax=Polytolypa hystricis (strain UAMH7299) TaxID=1447883 RepID=A0A2B7Y902_POLH7|nr:hypothetical protein AJ80_04734 [Polytolypa hystricis UAMH7299]